LDTIKTKKIEMGKSSGEEVSVFKKSRKAHDIIPLPVARLEMRTRKMLPK
jgi:hypothetical protein